MPKENTHLYFSEKIKNLDSILLEIINKNIKYFYLGSITPDTFYYSKKGEVKKVSDFIHGKEGNATNKIIFDLLNVAQKNEDEKLLVFIFGFLTHCYLDIVFHPVVFYLAGNLHDLDPHKRKIAAYKHRRLEVILDEKISKNFLFGNSINEKLFGDKDLILILSKQFDISTQDVESSFKRQFSLNKLFHRKYLLKIFYFLYKIHILKNRDKIGLYYGHLSGDDILKEEIEYQDLFTGETFKATISKLFDLANFKTRLSLASAYKYYTGEESKEEAEINIAGENLDTGSKIFSVNDIKFLKQK